MTVGLVHVHHAGFVRMQSNPHLPSIP
jgi:hypothetical protein